MEHSEKEKVAYFTPTTVIYHCRQFLARSIVTSSRPPGSPFVVYDEKTHGMGYQVCDLDEWREQINRSDR